MEAAESLITDGAVLGGRYCLLRLIARGGMAQVWEGRDAILDRPVAIKVLLPHLAQDPAFVERFRREAVAAARLTHPNVVSTYDTRIDGGVAFIVMELVRGRSLADLLASGGALDPGRARNIVLHVADALAYAHAAGVVHRDIKPANILIGDDGRVKVADFGIAKASAAGADLTQPGTMLGTAKYLAPEVIDGQPVDARADIYSLGVVLYEMVCGRAPFTGDTEIATALQHVRAEPLSPRQVRAGIPRSLDLVVMRAMAKSPDRRYASAGDLRTALASIDLADDDGDGLVARDPTPPTGVGSASLSRADRSWLVTVVLVVVVAIVLGVAGVLFSRTSAGRDLLHGQSSGAASTPAATAPHIVAAHAFDPPPPFGKGDGQEDDSRLPNLFDGNPSTSWSTETYTNSHFGNLKDGVGVYLDLDRAAKLGHLAVTSSSTGWSASVYVAAASNPRQRLSDWGPAVAHQDHIGGDVTFDLGGHRGQEILLWITDLGDGTSVTIGKLRVTS